MAIASGAITTCDPNAAIVEWFEKLGKYCASVDYDSASAIFADDVLSFGTKADIVSGLDPLQKNQWQGIWPNIQDFKINMETVHSGGDKHHAWGIATWTSTGFHEDGTSFHRPGRATVILERRNHHWVSVHTHFSLNPGTSPRTYGPKQPTGINVQNMANSGAVADRLIAGRLPVSWISRREIWT